MRSNILSSLQGEKIYILSKLSHIIWNNRQIRKVSNVKTVACICLNTIHTSQTQDDVILLRQVTTYGPLQSITSFEIYMARQNGEEKI